MASATDALYSVWNVVLDVGDSPKAEEMIVVGKYSTITV